MAREIERKFLVTNGSWRKEPLQWISIRQGYLSLTPACVIRVRAAGSDGFLTVKGKTNNAERLEYEYRIPRADADELLELLCQRPLIEKTRYKIQFRDHQWEVDEFHGVNAGLVVAEIELKDRAEKFEIPKWLGLEVTDDQRYFNSNLVNDPFLTWAENVGHG
jgi:CYTH domain-containing protein